MKLRKILSSIVAGAIAVSAVTLAASAELVKKVEPITLDPNGTKLVQYDIGILDGIEKVETVTVVGKASVADWVGGGGQVGFDTVDGWQQVDFSLDKVDELDSASGEYTAVLDFAALGVNTAPNFDKEDALLQVGWWWGSGDGKCQIKDLLVNGTSIMGVEAAERTPAEPEADEENADAAAEEAAPAEEEAPAEEVSKDFTAEFGAQFDSTTTDEWPSFADKQIKFGYGENAVITIDMGKKVKLGANYAAVNTDVPYVEGMKADFVSIKLDGKAIDMGAAYLNTEGIGGGLRLTICNKWNSDIKEQPVDVATLDEFQVLEITFKVEKPEEAAAAADEDDAAAVEDEAADADSDDDTAVETDPNADINDFLGTDNNNTLKLVGDGVGYIDVTGGDVTDIYGVIYYVSFDDDEVADPSAWIGGGIGANSTSTGWKQNEWGRIDKPLVPDFDYGQIIWVQDEPIFTDAEEYAQLWCVAWGGTMTVDSVELVTSENLEDAKAEVESIMAAAEERWAAEAAAAEDETDVDAAAPAEEETPAPAPAEDTPAPAPAAGEVDAATSDGKGSPDTGVADVAAIAGLAIVAAGAVLVTKKRK